MLGILGACIVSPALCGCWGRLGEYPVGRQPTQVSSSSFVELTSWTGTGYRPKAMEALKPCGPRCPSGSTLQAWVQIPATNGAYQGPGDGGKRPGRGDYGERVAAMIPIGKGPQGSCTGTCHSSGVGDSPRGCRAVLMIGRISSFSCSSSVNLLRRWVRIDCTFPFDHVGSVPVLLSWSNVRTDVSQFTGITIQLDAKKHLPDLPPGCNYQLHYLLTPIRLCLHMCRASPRYCCLNVHSGGAACSTPCQGLQPYAVAH